MPLFPKTVVEVLLFSPAQVKLDISAYLRMSGAGKVQDSWVELAIAHPDLLLWKTAPGCCRACPPWSL